MQFKYSTTTEKKTIHGTVQKKNGAIFARISIRLIDIMKMARLFCERKRNNPAQSWHDFVNIQCNYDIQPMKTAPIFIHISSQS